MRVTLIRAKGFFDLCIALYAWHDGQLVAVAVSLFANVLLLCSLQAYEHGLDWRLHLPAVASFMVGIILALNHKWGWAALAFAPGSLIVSCLEVLQIRKERRQMADDLIWSGALAAPMPKRDRRKIRRR